MGLFDKVKKVAEEVGKDVLDAAKDVADLGGQAAESIVDHLPAELQQLDSGTVAWIVKKADERGLLEGTESAKLKSAATRLNAGEQMPADELVALLPELIESGVVRKVIDDNVPAPFNEIVAKRALPVLEHLAKTAKHVSTGLRIKRTIDEVQRGGSSAKGDTPQPTSNSTRRTSTPSKDTPGPKPAAPDGPESPGVE